MRSSIVELKMLLGDSLTSDVQHLAASLKLKPAEWLFLFLAKGRLTPDVESELAEAKNDGIYFFGQGALNA